MGFTHRVNEYVAEYCAAAPDRLIPMGGVHPRFTDDAAAEVRRAADLGVRALKVHPPHMAVEPNAYLHGLDALRALYEEAQRLAPAGDDPHRHLDLPRRAQPHRRADGGGRRGGGLPRPDASSSPTAAGRSGWSRPSSWCAASRNVYMDVSSIPPKAVLRYFPRLAEIADKVLYGSDWPAPGVRSMADNLRDFRALGLAEDVLARILEGNARRVFG